MDGATGSTESTASAIFAIHFATVESATLDNASLGATLTLALISFVGSAYDRFVSESWSTESVSIYIMELDMHLNLWRTNRISIWDYECFCLCC